MGDIDSELLALHQTWVRSDGREGKRLVLRGADLRYATLTNTTLAGADFTEADLLGVQFGDSSLYRTVLRGANLVGASITGPYVNQVDLTGANLTGANLNKAELIGARLVGAVLRGAQCVKTDFSEADLTGVDLTRAFLVRTYLIDTALVGVDLTETDVRLDVGGKRIDVSRVRGMMGAIGCDTDMVTMIDNGQERVIRVTELVEVLNRRGAQVTTWHPGERPALVPWRWGRYGHASTIVPE